jgi:Glycosyl transferase family 2
LETEAFSTVESEFLTLVNGGFAPGATDVFLSYFRRHFSEDENWAISRELLIGLGQPGSVLPSFHAEITENDRPFAASIAAFTGLNFRAGSQENSAIQELGQEFDFLAEACFLPNLTPIQTINLLLLRRIAPTKSVAAVVTMRDEGLYLLEWIAFNRVIGLTDIFVYANDNIDGSDELLELLAAAGVIKLFRSSISRGTNPQRKAYQHAIHLLRELRNYKWALFLDADEFLVPDQRYDYRLDNLIRHVEDSFGENLPGAVVFPWDWRLSDRKFAKSDGLLFERYPHSISHFVVKSLTRLSAALGMCEVHIPTLTNGVMLVDSSLLPVETDFAWGTELKSRAGGAVAHFWGKSFEEFAIKKRRGELLSLDENPLLRDFSQFFEWTADHCAETFRPAPSFLIDRTYRALEELEALPGVESAVKRIGLKFEELSRKIQMDINLRKIFEEMRTRIQPVLRPA